MHVLRCSYVVPIYLASCSCGVISTRKQFYCEGNVAELYELITDNQRNAMPSDKLLLQDTSTVKSFSGEKLKGLSVSCTNTIGILLDPKFENKPCSYSYCREHMEDWFSKDNHYDVVQCPEDLEVQRGIDYIICVNSPILKILVECMNFCDNTQTQGIVCVLSYMYILYICTNEIMQN